MIARLYQHLYLRTLLWALKAEMSGLRRERSRYVAALADNAARLAAAQLDRRFPTPTVRRSHDGTH